MRRHTGGLLACFAALAVVLALPAAATARPGALDRGFNGDGKVVTYFPKTKSSSGLVTYALPFEFSPGRIAMAPGPGAGIVLANNKAIVEYLGNGRRNRRFGGGGAVPIGAIEGSQFQLADIAVDSQGRVLVAGTSKPIPAYGLTGQELAGPLPTVATIRRYLPSGELDPSFGSGGVLDTDLGAPSPTFEGAAYKGAAVAVVGLAVDSADRPIVTGSAVTEVGRCARSQERYQASQAIIARLTTGGAADTSFAGSGLKMISGLSWLGLPTLTRSGLFSSGTSTDPCPQGGPYPPSLLTKVSNVGSLAPRFAGDGLWSRPFTRISDIAAAPGGKLVLLTRTIELRGGEWTESAGRVVRLRGDGSFDRRFGHRGEASVRQLKHGWFAAVATDSRGRVLIAGAVLRKPRHKRYTVLRFILVRTTPAGKPDRRFGRRGRVTTGFGGMTNARATDVLVDRSNRIVVGGKFSGRANNNAFALARYLGGR